jgi:hypothetical protein
LAPLTVIVRDRNSLGQADHLQKGPSSSLGR